MICSRILKYFIFSVCKTFSVEPPHLDLEYLELSEPVLVKKTGDIFDDVKFYRKPFR